MLLDPAAPGSNPSIPDVAEVNQLCWFEEGGQWLENVDSTHLVLASGKPVLHLEVLKIYIAIQI